MNKVEQQRIQKIFDEKVWPRLIEGNINHIPENQPRGFVLGGQPGSGKSKLIDDIQEIEFSQKKALVVNGDDFRIYHPSFIELQNQYGEDASKHTGSFAGSIAELAIKKAVEEKRNIIIEGTFRTSETPLMALKGLKENGYKTGVAIKTCDKEISWQSTLDRYNGMKKAGIPPRKTPKESHDIVVNNLGANADKVLQSGLADQFKVYSREKLIFDKEKNNQLPSIAINKELKYFNDQVSKKVTERAQDFLNLPKEEALKKHPELIGTYQVQDNIHKEIAGGFSDAHRAIIEKKIVNKLAEDLSQGKLHEVSKAIEKAHER